MDYKKRVNKALENYYKRQEPDLQIRRKNEKPEELVVNDHLIWCKQMNWDVDVIESKSKFNTSTMRYSGRAASVGTSDICGNTSEGLGVYIETKAKGRRVGSALREGQREFLIRKIASGCFAIMSDDIEYTKRIWKLFQDTPPDKRTELLINELPEHNPRQMKFT